MKKTEEHMKGVISPVSTLFEELGFNYIGPVDGHNIEELVKTLKNMRELKGPQFLHVRTKKGKGYQPAENDPIGYHGVPKFDPASGQLPKAKSIPTYTYILGKWLCELLNKILSSSALPQLCVKAQAWWNFLNASLHNILMLPLLNNMRLPLRQV